MQLSRGFDKSIKKPVCILLMSFLIGCLFTGCIQPIHTGDENSPLQIVTTIFAPYDFARNVAGEYANVQMLLKPGEDVHSYEPSPQDIIAIGNCDIFIFTGGENDAWVDTILESMDLSHTKIIRMIDLVSLYEEADENGIVEVDEEDTEWDEHVWTDPQNAMIIAQEIATHCMSLLQEKGEVQAAAAIEQQSKEYCTQLEQLDAAFREVVQSSKRHMVVFADRFPLRYFVEAYGLSYMAAFPGCSSEAEPSAGKVAKMIDYMKAEHIPVVYKIELSNDNMSKTIAEECNCKVRVFYSCHNISKEDYERGETYLSLMYYNVDSLKEALNE